MYSVIFENTNESLTTTKIIIIMGEKIGRAPNLPGARLMCRPRRDRSRPRMCFMRQKGSVHWANERLIELNPSEQRNNAAAVALLGKMPNT